MHSRSLAAYQELPPVRELSPRVWNVLTRSGFVGKEPGKDDKLNIPKLRKAILNGKIWRVRGIGQATVWLLCEWLEQKDTSDTPPEEQQT